MRKSQVLAAVVMVGVMFSGCQLPQLPKIQSDNQNLKNISDISSKKPNQLTKKECETLLKMDREAKEAKKIVDEETRVKGHSNVNGNLIMNAAKKASELNKIYYLTEKIKYCRDLDE